MKIVSKASLMERVTRTRHGCWVWEGARWKEGYGILRVGDAQRPAPRLFWESFVGLTGQSLPIFLSGVWEPFYVGEEFG